MITIIIHLPDLIIIIKEIKLKHQTIRLVHYYLIITIINIIIYNQFINFMIK